MKFPFDYVTVPKWLVSQVSFRNNRWPFAQVKISTRWPFGQMSFNKVNFDKLKWIHYVFLVGQKEWTRAVFQHCEIEYAWKLLDSEMLDSVCKFFSFTMSEILDSRINLSNDSCNDLNIRRLLRLKDTFLPIQRFILRDKSNCMDFDFWKQRIKDCKHTGGGLS